MLLEGISVSVALGMVVTLCGVLAVSLEKTEDHERGPAENNTGKDGDVDGSIPDDVLLEVALDDARADDVSSTCPRVLDEAADTDAKPVVFSSGGDRMVMGYVAAALNVAKVGQPLRTIRVLFAGAEETGLWGSKAYSKAHIDEPIAVGIESDFGADRIWRIDSNFLLRLQ